MEDQINYVTVTVGVSAVSISSKGEVDRPAVQRVEAIRWFLLHLKQWRIQGEGRGDPDPPFPNRIFFLLLV